MRWTSSVCAVLVIGCGASAPRATTPEPVAETPAAREVEAPIAVAAPTPSPLEALIATLAADDASTDALPTPSASLAACAHPGDDDCAITSTAVWNSQAHQWIVLEVDGSEGGPESAQVIEATATSETVLAAHAIDRAGLRILAGALRPYAHLPPPTNLVTEAALTEFSSSSYASLVALAAPLEGWLLLLSTNDDLDHPEHVLSLVSRADRHAIELARQPAELIPCDGDGWTCAADETGTCTPAELRAEDRLCVQPRGIAFVGLSDDAASLVVLGIRIVAGDGGYPAHHWVAPITLPLR